MMYECSNIDGSSPFDEAMSKPFLGEPAKKKWSLTSCSMMMIPLPPALKKRVSSGTAATVLSDDDYTDSSDDSEFYDDDDDDSRTSFLPSRAGGNEYEAPVIEEVIVFDGDNNNKKSKKDNIDDLEEQQKVEPIMNGELELSTLVEGKLHPMDVEVGILKERQGSFSEMNVSMRQILEIQKDLSALVEEQDEDIEGLESTALLASEHAQDGVKHLLRATELQEIQDQRRNSLLLLLLVFITFLWVGLL